LVQFFGYASLGVAAIVISACAVILFSRVRTETADTAAAQGATG
jgi:hypothetical protein